MPSHTNLIFVNGPGLEGLKSHRERRLIRSQLQRYTYLKGQVPHEKAWREPRDLSLCTCADQEPSTSTKYLRPILPRTNAAVSERSICSQCGGTKGSTDVKKGMLMTLSRAEPGLGAHDPFADPRLTRMDKRYHEFMHYGKSTTRSYSTKIELTIIRTKHHITGIETLARLCRPLLS